jgi:type II secretory ATPase GspE/PulE/Tfp pilus assembly ATPase PilB-like protein
MDMGIEPFLIASSMLAMLAQRLVRLICPVCRASTVPAQEIVRDLSRTAEVWIHDGGQFAQGMGCEMCNGSGYRGRTGIYELLPLDDTIRELIMQRANANMIKAAAVKAGMRTLLQNGSQKVLEGLTTAEEVLRVTQDSEHAEPQLPAL